MCPKLRRLSRLSGSHMLQRRLCCGKLTQRRDVGCASGPNAMESQRYLGCAGAQLVMHLNGRLKQIWSRRPRQHTQMRKL